MKQQLLKKTNKFSNEVEHLAHVIAFQTGVQLTYKEKSALQKNMLDKFSYNSIIDGILVLPRLSSPIIAITFLKRTIVEQIKKKEDRASNLNKINDILGGLKGKAYGRK
jgi:hypothetical protein